MKFARDPQSAVTVRHVERGMLRIGNDEVRENVVLFRDTVHRGWDGGAVENLSEADFATLLDDAPEVVILGTGWRTRRPPRELVFAMARRGVGFEVMDTPAACRTFNILIGEDRDVAAILLLD